MKIFLTDLDDTLLDFGRAEHENLRRTFCAAGIELTGELHAAFHRINDGLWRLLERGGISREELKVERFRRLFAEYGIRADAEKLAAFYFEGFPEICYPFAGARAFLERLSLCGRVYIATNGGAKIQRRHLGLAGFWPFITGVFISEEMGADKPSQAYVERVKEGIEGYETSRAFYLGDSLTSDMVCAERLGATFVRFDPAQSSERQYEAFLALAEA